MDGNYSDYIFDFERLEVYQLAIEFVTEVINMIKELPPDLRFSLGNNFIRASTSIANNIAEGSGKRSKREKKLFYGYALTSAQECIPTITILRHQMQVDETRNNSLRSCCIKICNMIGRLIVSVNKE